MTLANKRIQGHMPLSQNESYITTSDQKRNANCSVKKLLQRFKNTISTTAFLIIKKTHTNQKGQCWVQPSNADGAKIYGLLLPLDSLLFSKGLFKTANGLYNLQSNLWYVGHEALCHRLIISLLSHSVNEAKITALIGRWASALRQPNIPNLQLMTLILPLIYIEFLLFKFLCVYVMQILQDKKKQT